SKLIIAVSESTKRDIIKFLNVREEKINIIYEGARFNLLKFFSEKGKQEIKNNLNIGDFILYIGSFHPRKNLVNLIKAFSYIIPKYSNSLYLIVVGYFSKKEVKNIDLLLNFLSLQRYVKLLGHISDEKIKQLFLTAKVFVFPSLYEGFGLPPLEAMACGCPVVVSNCGSLPEVCGDAAVYVNPYEPQDIANGILKVLTDESLRQQLIKKGFEQVKKFTWENSVKKFIETLKKLQNNDIK
ncbi:MAG: glycosyltransferase family 1 protein, partial [Candidatus Anstonellales archaeon]